MELACFDLIWYFEIMMILNFMKLVYELFGYLIWFVGLLFYPQVVLAARLLAEQSQLAFCKNRIDLRKDPRPRFTPAFRILWVVLSRFLDGWEELAQLMQPVTVKKWHTTAFKFYWQFWGSKKIFEHFSFFCDFSTFRPFCRRFLKLISGVSDAHMTPGWYFDLIRKDYEEGKMM
jgi:hypothetical protein